MNIIYCILSYMDFSLIFAYDDLSYNNVATQSHTFTGTGYDASRAVDGNAATCVRTKDIGRTSYDKTVWWKVDLGGVYNINNINILFKNYEGYENRQRGRFAGFSLHISNTSVIQGSTLCYKDGPQLPLLNFTSTCTVYGRYVIFYNERLDGVIYPEGYQTTIVYTEICEVIVNGCKMPGMYGSFCNKTCPKNCKEAVCHVQNGDCLTCQPGWTGATCNNNCTEGFYGRNCSHVCSPNCKICRHTDGLCACKAGWSGPRCTEECIRSYGENCQYSCNTNCINMICDRFNGTCLFGCVNGRTCDLASQQHAETDNDGISCTPWIIAFSIALVIIIILIIATIRLWRTSIKGNSNAGSIQSSKIPAAGETQAGLSDCVSHYQELSVSKEHNTYLTLTL